MKRLLLTILAVLSVLSLSAQNRTVSGKVVDEKGEPLPGATLVAGSNYTVTDIDGHFTLTAKTGESVTVSYMGYEDFVFTVSQDNMSISLIPSEAIMLNEAVAIGYGKTTKKEITGSVVSLKSDDFDKGSFTSAAGMLQGKVAGLTVTNPDGGDPKQIHSIPRMGSGTPERIWQMEVTPVRLMPIERYMPRLPVSWLV